jgi:hypothetical protein
LKSWTRKTPGLFFLSKVIYRREDTEKTRIHF